MSETFSKVEVITGVARRWRFTTDQKLAVVSETSNRACRSAMFPSPWALPEPDLQMETTDERRGQGSGPGG
jgi:hypothetical protein